MKHCEACHSQLREDGSHYQMTACVQEEITNLKTENERLKKAAGLVVRMQKDFDDGNRDQLITVKDCIISLAEATKESEWWSI